MNEVLKNTCKLGQKEKQCKYLIMDDTSFKCGKLNQDVKESLDVKARNSDIEAKSDNCSGINGTIWKSNNV